MDNYEQLVKALRCNALSKQCDSCKYGYHLCPDSECNDACNVEQIYADAAAAIEALWSENDILHAHIEDMNELFRDNSIKIEELQAEVKRLEDEVRLWKNARDLERYGIDSDELISFEPPQEVQE